jgi:hypothetical protein
MYLIAEMREPPYWGEYPGWRVKIHHIVTSKYFDLVIAGVIGLNVISMAMEFYMMPDVINLNNILICLIDFSILIGIGVHFENVQLLFHFRLYV